MPILASTNGTHTLFIDYDPDPINPRTACSNFGKMICFHSRYSLGDKHSYKTSSKLFSDLLLADDFTRPISTADMMKNLNESPDIAILPLYLYDHSGITMNTSGFSCSWDSGQVGIIYATRDMIQKEFGDASPDSVTKAKDLLELEVKCYDLYLTGQCYGYQLYEGENEIDSCWGFLGSLDGIQKVISDYLPEPCRCLVGHLSDCRYNTVAEYFWDIKLKAS